MNRRTNGELTSLGGLLPPQSQWQTDLRPESLDVEERAQWGSEYGCKRCHDKGWIVERVESLDDLTKDSQGKYRTKTVPCPSCRPEPKPFGLPDDLEKASFENFLLNANPTMKAAKYACEAVARGDKWSAMLIGDPGLGKSHLGAAALNVRGGTFWEVAALLLNIRKLAFAHDGPQLEEEAVVAVWENYQQLLVLDDMGQEKHKRETDGGPGWVDQTLYTILNARYTAKLPTIITSNYPDRIADPILSRFSEGTVLCKGADYRRRGLG